ncbi:hypothetical protein XH98_29935 [Bradyrhizobium sp. CCBAU 51745]|uniref:hypothetical protein n=1 Tax=Bradyrhizobium sp. CCBAU 51745 TaxID=1325099 RepID=UPI0023050D3C|nr:hypothetical protein [Bradyrhizobium sp. CCBAU 51745]MDA9443238.1 hypothetical protein [Bradyrhizobium sp. CCBAU 51745]
MQSSWLHSSWYASIKRHILPIALCATSANSAVGWEIYQFGSRSSRHTETTAVLRSAGATLYVGCLHGEVTPALEFGVHIGREGIEVSFSFDDGPAERYPMVSRADRFLWLWKSDGKEVVKRLRHSARLKVSLPDVSFDFDLTKGGHELSQFKCAPFPV